MLTIGALARLAGTTTRTIRHYHQVGVLSEPTRRVNGYREYDLRDAVRLVRVRRLVGLGLSLSEVADVLRAGPGGEGELREVLADLDADLAEQERAIAERRRRLAGLRARSGDLAASEEVVDLLREVSAAAPGASAEELARERDLLEMVEAMNEPERFAEFAGQYRQALADPEQLEQMTALAARFEALAEADAANPRVEELARDLADAGLGQFPDDAPQDESWKPAWAAFLATLPPAQRRCMQLGWERRSRWLSAPDGQA